MFAPTGLIINPNNPRPAQNDWGGAPYGPLHTPVVTCGSLLPRNRNYFNINLPNGAVPGVAVNLACHHVVGWDILWGFWNKLITLKHFKEARSFLGLFGAPQATTKDLEKIIQKKQFNTRGANWEAQMCWHPRNIVRGPNDRSDDPNQNNKLEDKIDFKLAKADIYEGR